ncbi:GspH/FimT family pseudopilin [Vibrio diazotrophicus]|uniref:GspH/FimT family pseudopilin n=1 Tax=Vibrio diazotrophicus TaxID=685 RepID=UPI000C9EBA4E|nr:GspH/FimT family pseudopilin [Vibrio diazotrophicus]PNH81004.1 pilus assembly protein FimT [Vibrio diazotrophicus]
MLRGFTLLEMLVTLAVLTTLLYFSAPNFYQFQQKQRIITLAQDLHGFLVQAKSEAIYRNQDLWAHIHLSNDPTRPELWEIRLTDSDQNNRGQTIQVMSGVKYRDVIFSSEYASNQIKFDGVRGKITNGHLSLSLVLFAGKRLLLKSSFGASRIIVCGESEALYGYPKCD